jgi:protein TonB
VEVVTQVDVNFTLGGAPSSVGGDVEMPQGFGFRQRGIHVDGNEQAAKLTHAPKPEYPQLAQQVRIQGTVRYNVLIDKTGKIADTNLNSGHPLLVPAAQDAIRRYKYQPTLLNGDPVEVETQVEVNFRLP